MSNQKYAGKALDGGETMPCHSNNGATSQMFAGETLKPAAVGTFDLFSQVCHQRSLLVTAINTIRDLAPGCRRFQPLWAHPPFKACSKLYHGDYHCSPVQAIEKQAKTQYLLYVV